MFIINCVSFSVSSNATHHKIKALPSLHERTIYDVIEVSRDVMFYMLNGLFYPESINCSRNTNSLDLSADDECPKKVYGGENVFLSRSMHKLCSDSVSL